MTRKSTGRVLGEEALIEIWIVSKARFVPGHSVRRPGALQRIRPSTPRQTREQPRDNAEDPHCCACAPNVLVLCHMMSSAQVSGHEPPPGYGSTGSGAVCDSVA